MMYKMALFLSLTVPCFAFAGDVDQVLETGKKEAQIFLKELEKAQSGQRNCGCPSQKDVGDFFSLPSVTELTSPSQDKVQLVVFASFSMPEASLKQLSSDLDKVGGRLVFRGLFQNSFAKTREKVIKIGITFDIDPTLFEAFDVKVVPTFAVYQGEEKKEFILLQGNTSLRGALEILEQEGKSKEIKGFLKKL